MKRRQVLILFWIVVSLTLTVNFKTNVFSSAADIFFDYFQMDGESLVIGRLLLSEEKGLTEHAGFLGWTHPEPDVKNKYRFQYDAYHTGFDEAFYRRQKALTATLWVSLLAPLSWFVIFKGHSAIHTHMNPIVWYMPFLLFGFILTGSTCWRLIRQTWLKQKI